MQKLSSIHLEPVQYDCYGHLSRGHLHGVVSSHSPQRVSFAGCILLLIRTWIVSSAALADRVFPCCASSDDAPWVNFYNFG